MANDVPLLNINHATNIIVFDKSFKSSAKKADLGQLIKYNTGQYMVMINKHSTSHRISYIAE